MAKARDYTRVFPSPERQVAAVVTWSRPADPERGLEVTARVSVRMVDGAELRSFPIEPLSAVDITDDGAFVVAHGEQMSRLIQCGVQQTRLAFYDGVGRELARFEPLDLSPSYSTAILTDARRFVITATGRVIAYDLSGTGVIWTLPLERRSDRPFLSLDARAERLAVVVHQPSGGAQIRTSIGTESNSATARCADGSTRAPASPAATISGWCRRSRMISPPITFWNRPRFAHCAASPRTRRGADDADAASEVEGSAGMPGGGAWVAPPGRDAGSRAGIDSPGGT